jgi:hypothetical protein
MRRALTAIVLMLAATGAGIAAASAIVPQPREFEQQPDRLLPGPAEPMTGATAAEPRGGPDWAVRTYVSRTGLLCTERGRLRGDVFGDLREDGGFEPRPPGATGMCGDGRQDPVLAAVDRLPAHAGQPEVTIVYGTSLRRLRAVTVEPDGGEPVDLPIGARSTFIGRFAGLRTPAALPLTVVFADGSSERIAWDGAP